jgi:acetolactate synthase-1/2/3 large subunit
MMTGAEALVESLINEQVDTVFGIPGSKFLDVLDAMWFKREQIRFITTRHEQGAAFMAMGLAIARRSVGVCYATLGPGTTNLATGIGDAYKNAVPVVALGGMMASYHLGRDGWQEIDQVGVMRPITKESAVVPHAQSIPLYIRRAFRTAKANLPGPVYLTMPMDQLTANVEYQGDNEAGALYRPIAVPEYAADASAVKQIVGLLNEAMNPVILAGREVNWEAADGELLQLAEKFNIPVLTTLEGHGGLPTTHPLVLGPTSKSGGWPVAVECLKKADVVLAIGVKFDFHGTGFDYSLLPRQAALIHVSGHPEFIGTNFPAKINLVASVKRFARDLVNATAGVVIQKRNQQPWQDKMAAWRLSRRRDLDNYRSTAPINPRIVAEALNRYTGGDAFFVFDGGNFKKFLVQQLEFPKPGMVFKDDGFGCVGSAFPIALGYQAGRPDCRVFCATGDMGYLLNGAELETAVRENLPVVTIIFNDYGLGNIREYQDRKHEGRQIGVDYSPVDYAAAARAFGAYGERVERAEDVEPALKRAVESGRPAVLDVLVDKKELAAK